MKILLRGSRLSRALGSAFLNRAKNSNKILIVSIQKCGTHLIERVLLKAGFSKGQACNGPLNMSHLNKLRGGQFLLTHFCPSDDVQMALEGGDPSLKIIFNYRDPRDALVSWFHWMHPANPSPMHAHMSFMQKVYSSFTDEELVDIFLKCDKFRAVEYNPIEHFRYSRVLLFHPAVLNVRFEDLIGPNGGGSKEAQIRTVKAITDLLDLQVDENLLAEEVYSTQSPTFRKGKIGGYRDFFTQEQLAKFEILHGDVIAQYGYELDAMSGSSCVVDDC